jgi:hypothetical protein
MDIEYTIKFGLLPLASDPLWVHSNPVYLSSKLSAKLHFISHRSRSVSAIEAGQLTLFREVLVIAIYFESV